MIKKPKVSIHLTCVLLEFAAIHRQEPTFIRDYTIRAREYGKSHQQLFIPYCSIAGFIGAWAISGLLVIVDIISGTPAGTFFCRHREYDSSPK
jgi:hypothetical protein